MGLLGLEELKLCFDNDFNLIPNEKEILKKKLAMELKKFNNSKKYKNDFIFHNNIFKFFMEYYYFDNYYFKIYKSYNI